MKKIILTITCIGLVVIAVLSVNSQINPEKRAYNLAVENVNASAEVGIIYANCRMETYYGEYVYGLICHPETTASSIYQCPSYVCWFRTDWNLGTCANPPSE